MSQIQYLDKHDKEFINLMIEINNRTKDFSKIDKLKINSWIKSLCLPTNNIPWKKNRNLYALKLLDNVLNSKLEFPFTKFAQSDNLPMLNPILIKSQLSNKIGFIINNIYSEEQIENFINSNMENNNKEINNDIKLDLINKKKPVYRAKTPTHQNMINYKNKKFCRKYMNYNNIQKEKNNEDIFYKGDQLLNKNYFDFDKKLSNEPGFYKKTKRNVDIEKNKLKATIADLENEYNIKNQLINQQESDILQLKNRISFLEKKVEFAFKK